MARLSLLRSQRRNCVWPWLAVSSLAARRVWQLGMFLGHAQNVSLPFFYRSSIHAHSQLGIDASNISDTLYATKCHRDGEA